VAEHLTWSSVIQNDVDVSANHPYWVTLKFLGVPGIVVLAMWLLALLACIYSQEVLRNCMHVTQVCRAVCEILAFSRI
jgi:hypothetical protein